MIVYQFMCFMTSGQKGKMALLSTSRERRAFCTSVGKEGPDAHQQEKKTVADQHRKKTVADQQGKKTVTDQQGKKTVADQQGKKTVADQQGKKTVADQQGKKTVTDQQGKKTVADQQGKKTVADQQGKKTVTDQQGKKTVADQQGKKTVVNQQGKKAQWAFILSGLVIFLLLLFFFYMGFTALSRIFHIYWADRSSKVGKNQRTRGKTTWPSVSRTWLSHMWPEPGSNHSCEKPNGLRVSSLIHKATGARSGLVNRHRTCSLGESDNMQLKYLFSHHFFPYSMCRLSELEMYVCKTLCPQLYACPYKMAWYQKNFLELVQKLIR